MDFMQKLQLKYAIFRCSEGTFAATIRAHEVAHRIFSLQRVASSFSGTLAVANEFLAATSSFWLPPKFSKFQILYLYIYIYFNGATSLQ